MSYIWDPDFGIPSVFLVSPTKQEIWHHHAKFPREFGIPCYSIQITVMVPYVTITWNIYYSSIVRLLLEIALNPHTWGGTSFATFDHIIICFWHLTSAKQFNLHTGEVGLVMEPALVCGKGIIVSFENISTHAVSSWKGRNSVLLHYALLTWCDPRISGP